MIFSVSTRKHKKYSVVTPKGKVVHFGSRTNFQYKDTTGLRAYSHLDHLDPVRKRNYRRRARGIRNRRGKAVYRDKESPAYYSYNFLW
jgi:hypothetical protein